MFLQLRSGAIKEFRLTSNPKIYLTDTSLKVVSDTHEYEIDRHQVLLYRIDEYTGVAEVNADHPIVDCIGLEVLLTGLSEGTSVELYNMQGMLLCAIKSKGGEVRLKAPQPGLYLVRTNEFNFKVLLSE